MAENKAFLKPSEAGIQKNPGAYGFYTKDSDSSQLEIGKGDSGIPTIAPGTGITSSEMSKKAGKRNVIHTTGGF